MCAALDGWGGRGRFMLALCGAGAALLLGCQLLRHYTFETPAYDLRIHEELVANTLRGRLLYSDLLGTGYLSYHVSLIFPLCAPLYAVWPSPVTLLLLQGVLAGCAGWWLWRMALASGLRPMIALALVCSFFMFKGLHTGYFRGFQQEVLGMCFAMGFLWAIREDRRMAAAALGFLTLSCREDFGLFLLGAGVVWLCRRGRRAHGVATLVASAAWLVLAYGVVIPGHSPSDLMTGADRWAQYGSTPAEIASYWVRHPLAVCRAVANHGAVGHLRRLLFLPLASPGTVFTIAAPWIIYTTSAFGQQASLSGAYGSMFAAFLFAGAIRALAYARARALLSRDATALSLFLVLLAVNARLCPLPRTVAGARAAHAALAQLNRGISGKRVIAQGCIIPHVGRSRRCDMLGSPRASAACDYDIVLVSLTKDPWPLEAPALKDIVGRLSESPAWEHATSGCLEIFRKKPPPAREESPNQAPGAPARSPADPLG